MQLNIYFVSKSLGEVKKRGLLWVAIIGTLRCVMLECSVMLVLLGELGLCVHNYYIVYIIY